MSSHSDTPCALHLVFLGTGRRHVKARMRDSSALQIVCIFMAALASCTSGSSICDCSRLSLLPKPVCGGDGITYTNLCVAECQGVPVAKQGACSKAPNAGASAASSSQSAGSSAEFLDMRHADSRGRASVATLNRFRAEGLNFIGKFKLSPGKAVEPGLAAKVATEAVATRMSSRDKVFSLRVTSDGDVYVGTATSPAMAVANAKGDADAFMPGYDPKHNISTANHTVAGGRKLKDIHGRDDRFETTSHAYPWSAVGYLGTGCSGALIARRTVLTAGHCVYDTATRRFFAKLHFIPNRHGGGNHWQGSSRHTERVVAWEWVNTYFNNAGRPVRCSNGRFACQTPNDFKWDFAVVRLTTNIGNTYGWLGYGYRCGSNAYRSVNTAGYPSDRDRSMSRMFRTSGGIPAFSGCSFRGDTWADYVYSYTLDCKPGQSGSSVWGSDNTVRGILVSSGTGVKTITRWVFNELQRWRV